MSLLAVDGLSLRYPGGGQVLDGLSFGIGRGESVALVGESGSGKTQAALAILGLSGRGAALAGSVRFEGEELLGAPPALLNRYRARRMAMVFQDPLAALNPYLPLGRQLATVLETHGIASGRAARRRAVDALERVGLPVPGRQARAFPHELSGGMRQRAMIASALIAGPELLIADEPTTALDVTVQAGILELLRDLRRRLDTALLLITHDMGVVAGNCDRTLVIDDGRLVEEAGTRELFARPRHARTRALLDAARHGPATPPAPAKAGPALVAVSELRVRYVARGGGRGGLAAVRDASFELGPGETVALVGESGSGKSSLARALTGLVPRASGGVLFGGESLDPRIEYRPLGVKRRMQLVFQDPAGSLDPAMRVGAIVAEPLSVHEPRLPARERDGKVAAMLARVGLPPALAGRYPGELSGGQAQRVALARALIAGPSLLVLDEAVNALDGPLREDILALLLAEQRERGLALLFISHDLGVVRRVSHRLLVMYLGRICESGPAEAVFARPRHPYTRLLIDSIPRPDPAAPPPAAAPQADVASPLAPPPGCSFHPRCPWAVDRCLTLRPRLEREGARLAACHRAAELDLSIGQEASGS